MKPEKVASIRKSLEMTQIVFANLLGVHPLTVSKWERGCSPVAPYKAALIVSFGRAAQDCPGIGRKAAQLLITDGCMRALHALLKADNKIVASARNYLKIA